jgi:hypothetical protein
MSDETFAARAWKLINDETQALGAPRELDLEGAQRLHLLTRWAQGLCNYQRGISCELHLGDLDSVDLDQLIADLEELRDARQEEEDED